MPSRRSVTRWKAEAIQASTRVRPWGILGLGALHVPDQVDIEGRHWTDDDFKTKTFSSSSVLDDLPCLCLAFSHLLDFFHQWLSCLSSPLHCSGTGQSFEALSSLTFQFEFCHGLVPEGSQVSRKSGRDSSTFLVQINRLA